MNSFARIEALARRIMAGRKMTPTLRYGALQC
jgi:hypothetical protein